MQKTPDRKIRAVLLYIDGIRTEKEICEIHGIVPRTFRRWVRAYRNGGIGNLHPRKRGPPRGRGKIENYHKVLYKELIVQVRFSSLSHFRQELRKFDSRYNRWRKSQALGWNAPASVYNNTRYFNKRRQRP